jgi:long-chain fatty acid transport protein
VRRALVATLVLLARVALAADGAFPTATSPKAAGRGGTNLAVADDAFTVSANPAGMTSFDRTRIDLSLAFYTAQVSYTNGFNHGRVEQGFPLPAPALGFVHALGAPEPPVPGEEWPDPAPPFAIGLVLEPVSGGGGKALFRTPVFPAGEWETSNLAVLGLSLGFAARVERRVSLGLTITGLYASLDQKGLAGGTGSGDAAGLVRNFSGGGLQPNDPNFLVNGQPAGWSQVLGASGGPTSFSSALVELDGAEGFGFSATAGVLVQATDFLSIGATYRSPGWLSPLEGRALLDVSAGVGSDPLATSFLANHLPDGGALTSRFRARLSGLRMPQEAGIGAAIWPHPRVLLALDLKWIGWSGAFDTVKVDLRDGTGRDISEITSNQLSSAIRSRVLLGWRDQVVVGIGGAVAVNDWLRLRAGYRFVTNPVPTRTEGPFTPATVEHHATVGVGFVVGPVSIDLAWVHAFAKSTTIDRSDVSPDFVGMRHKADQDSVLLGGGIDF